MIATTELIEQARLVCTCGTCVTCLLREKVISLNGRLRQAENVIHQQAEAYSEWERQQASALDRT